MEDSDSDDEDGEMKTMREDMEKTEKHLQKLKEAAGKMMEKKAHDKSQKAMKKNEKSMNCLVHEEETINWRASGSPSRSRSTQGLQSRLARVRHTSSTQRRSPKGAGEASVT